MMFRVVPAKEGLAMCPCVFDRAEAFGEVGPVLQGLELCLGVRIVVGDVRSAVGLGHLQIHEQGGHGLGAHARARSACRVRVPGEMLCLPMVSAMSCSASSAVSR